MAAWDVKKKGSISSRTETRSYPINLVLCTKCSPHENGKNCTTDYRRKEDWFAHPYTECDTAAFRAGEKWYWLVGTFPCMIMLANLSTLKFQIQSLRNGDGALIRVEVGGREWPDAVVLMHGEYDFFDAIYSSDVQKYRKNVRNPSAPSVSRFTPT